MKFSAYIPLLFGLVLLCGSTAYANVCLPEEATAHNGCLVESNPSFEKTLCLEDYFVNMAYLESAEKAISTAKQMQQDGKIDDCHIVAHMVGKANLIKYNYDLGRALGTCSMDCIQGCIHGAVQNYVSEKVDVANIKTELSKVCNSLDKTSLIYAQCVHGIGHGFLTNNYMSIPEAIKACQSLGGKDSHDCLGGLFMENMQKNLLLSEDEFKDALPMTCKAMENSEDRSLTHTCFDSIGEGIMFYTGHNLARSLEYCALASSSLKNIHACKQGARTEAQTVILGHSQSHH
jgi:hypothetical protein